jgi:hypothetical protein
VIGNPLANEILAGHFAPGDTIVVDLSADNKATFSKAGG